MQQTTINVQLDFYKPEYEETLRKFTLPAEQERFTALPSTNIEAASGTAGQFPVVILDHNEPVGFFILHSSQRVADYTENQQALLLTALSVDHSKQGKGYAKKGMGLLKQFAAEFFPEFNEIVLAVNEKNINAQKLYEKVGYQDTGRRKMGKIGQQMIFSFPL